MDFYFISIVDYNDYQPLLHPRLVVHAFGEDFEMALAGLREALWPPLVGNSTWRLVADELMNTMMIKLNYLP